MKRKVTAVIVFIVFFLICFYVWDPDFGWHFENGRYILAHGIPAHDIFSYTASDYPWYNHSWLHDIIAYLLMSLGGKIAVTAVFSLLLTWSLFIASRKTEPITMFLSAIAMSPFVYSRPGVWSILFFVIIERWLESENKKRFYLIPLIFMIWANLHGGFILGLVTLVIYKFFKKTPISWAIIGLSLAATFINPFGANLYREIFEILFDLKLHARIMEWQYLVIPLITYAAIVPLIGVYLAMRTETRIWTKHNKDLILPALLGVAALISPRHIPFFVVSAMRFFEKGAADFLAIFRSKSKRNTALVLFAIVICYAGGSLYFFSKKNNDISYPEKAATYLQNNPCEGNLFNSYNYGGFLIGKLPDKKVYIDGRMPSWRTKDVDYFADYRKILDDPAFRASQFAKYNITCVLVKDDEKGFIEPLVKENWEKVSEEEGSVLLMRY